MTPLECLTEAILSLGPTLTLAEAQRIAAHYPRHERSQLMSYPPPVTFTLATLAAAVESHLTARGPQAKLHAWRHLEAKLAEANDLLKAVI